MSPRYIPATGAPSGIHFYPSLLDVDSTPKGVQRPPSPSDDETLGLDLRRVVLQRRPMYAKHPEFVDFSEEDTNYGEDIRYWPPTPPMPHLPADYNASRLHFSRTLSVVHRRRPRLLSQHHRLSIPSELWRVDVHPEEMEASFGLPGRLMSPSSSALDSPMDVDLTHVPMLMDEAFELREDNVTTPTSQPELEYTLLIQNLQIIEAASRAFEIALSDLSISSPSGSARLEVETTPSSANMSPLSYSKIIAALSLPATPPTWEEEEAAEWERRRIPLPSPSMSDVSLQASLSHAELDPSIAYGLGGPSREEDDVSWVGSQCDEDHENYITDSASLDVLDGDEESKDQGPVSTATFTDWVTGGQVTLQFSEEAHYALGLMPPELVAPPSISAPEKAWRKLKKGFKKACSAIGKAVSSVANIGKEQEPYIYVVLPVPVKGV